jgi:hypothetical protein
MKKTAYATMLILAFLFSAGAQVVMVMANAYPYIPTPWGYPEIAVTSPVQNGTYSQNDVWLNLTVTKPSNWTDFDGQLKYVAYLMDGSRTSLIDSLPYDSVGETRVAVEDPLGIVNSPLEFNLTIKLEGLSEGNHHVDVAAEGIVKNGESDVPVGVVYDDTIYFTVTGESSPSPTPTPSPKASPFPTNYTGARLTETEIIIGAIITAAVISAGIGLLIYLIKRK